MTAQGYRRLTYNETLFVEDIYDAGSVRVVDGVPTIQPFSVNGKLIGRENDLTWDDIRAHRNQILEGSDSSIAEDMPEDMKNTWKAYRQKLRDLPGDLESCWSLSKYCILHVPIPTILYYSAIDDPEPPADASAL